MRKTIFSNNEYYHICNRGVDKRKIFVDKNDYERFLLGMKLLNDEKTGVMSQWKDAQRSPKVQPWANSRLNLGEQGEGLIQIVAYCLNPNHYHLILKQVADDGVVKFMQKLGTAYTMYFNKKHDRTGALFQGRFKSIHVNSNESLLYLSAYVNGNHFVHGYGEMEWKYSSMLDYLGKRNGGIIQKDDNMVFDQFKNGREYMEFAKNYIGYMKDKKETKKYLLE